MNSTKTLTSYKRKTRETSRGPRGKDSGQSGDDPRFLYASLISN